MKKKIILFEDSSKVGFGGGQNITLQVADILSKEYNISFIDFTSSSRYFKLIDEKFHNDKKIIFRSGIIKRTKNKHLQLINEALAFIIFRNSNIKRLASEIDLNGCVIYATTRRALMYSEKINKKFGIPYVYHAHLVERTNSLGYRFIKNALINAKSIICVSKVVQRSIQLKNTMLLYNPSPNNQKTKSEKKDNRFVIASIGSLIQIKGVEHFIKAAKMFDDISNVEFRVYGEGIQKNELQQMANKNVVMKGFCSNIIEELKNEIDILVLCTTIEEALPTVIIEAKSVGIPVIATNIGGQAEIVEDGIDGFLIPTKSETAICESIKKFIFDIDTYNRMSNASLKSAQRFSSSKFEKKLLNEIDKL